MVQWSFRRVLAVVTAMVSVVVMSSISASAAPTGVGSPPPGGGSPQQEAPSAPRVEVYPRSGRLTLRIQESGSSAGRFRLEVAPAGLTRTGDLPDGAAVVDLTGLPNGVPQTVTVTVLGTDGDSAPTVVTARPVMSRTVTAVPDVTGDGRVDVLATPAFSGDGAGAVTLYPGTRSRLQAGEDYLGPETACTSLSAIKADTMPVPTVLCTKLDLLGAIAPPGWGITLGARGWDTMRWVDGGFSLNADPYDDVIAMNPKGELLLYAKTSKDKLLAPTRIGTGWQTMLSVVSAGDIDGDGRNDIAAVDAEGRLWLYPGNGKGGVTARRQIGAKWQDMGALVPMRDFDGDGRADLGGITMDGRFRLYKGTARGGVKSGVVIGKGWQGYL